MPVNRAFQGFFLCFIGVWVFRKCKFGLDFVKAVEKSFFKYVYNNVSIQLKTKLTPLEKRCQFGS